MHTLRADCSNQDCGELELPDDIFTLYFPEEPAKLEVKGQLEFKCPICDVVVVKQVSTKVLDKLACGDNTVFDFNDFKESLDPDMFN
jgi:hypothetical protein